MSVTDVCAPVCSVLPRPVGPASFTPSAFPIPKIPPTLPLYPAPLAPPKSPVAPTPVPIPLRLIFEVYYAKNIRYLKITLPRADSKLDKEQETKKDFKEKLGMMSMFYKAIHKLSEA